VIRKENNVYLPKEMEKAIEKIDSPAGI